MWAGRRCSVAPKVTLDRDMCKAHMDPIDAGTEPKEPAERKHERSWTRIEVDPHRWVGKGLPAEVEQMMTEGVQVDGPLLSERYGGCPHPASSLVGTQTQIRTRATGALATGALLPPSASASTALDVQQPSARLVQLEELRDLHARAESLTRRREVVRLRRARGHTSTSAARLALGRPAAH